MKKLYRQVTLTDDQRDEFVFPHKMAMTGEDLHSKSEIAYELGVRDKRIADFLKELDLLTEFVSWSLEAVFTGSDICGDEAQNKMFALGILTREIYNPEVHILNEGSECDPGDYIYLKKRKEDEQ
jgi:hypothetical protein